SFFAASINAGVTASAAGAAPTRTAKALMPSAPAPLSTSRFVSFLRKAFPNLLSGQAFGAKPNRLGRLGKSPGRPVKAYLRPGAKAQKHVRVNARNKIDAGYLSCWEHLPMIHAPAGRPNRASGGWPWPWQPRTEIFPLLNTARSCARQS